MRLSYGYYVVTPVRFIHGQGWLTDLPDVRVRTRFGAWLANRWLARLGLRGHLTRCSDRVRSW